MVETIPPYHLDIIEAVPDASLAQVRFVQLSAFLHAAQCFPVNLKNLGGFAGSQKAGERVLGCLLDLWVPAGIENTTSFPWNWKRPYQNGEPSLRKTFAITLLEPPLWL